MCRLGAEVVGIDASARNIKVAKLHAKKNNLRIKYLCASPENLKTQTKFKSRQIFFERSIDVIQSAIFYAFF